VAASRDDLLRIHDTNYLDRLASTCDTGGPFIDTPDSMVCTESYSVALQAAGGVMHAADMIAEGEISRAFCAVRPPGHHCERDRSLGFCLLNNIALAASRLKEVHGLRRLAILDWDVHHGNGTQHSFEHDPDILFVSLHQDPRTLFPGTGYAEEIGIGDGTGTVLNIPLPPGTGPEQYLEYYRLQALAAIESFGPQMLLISAGFDAHRLDPLANLELENETFQTMGILAVELAVDFCGGRVLGVMEGGYNLDILADCCCDFVQTLLKIN
jgi:acetoin utilization deacetylase AcuC-like enzyme